MSAPQTQTGDFTHQASAYAAARPTYPADLIDTLMLDAGVKPGDAVTDIGAGTGISTVLLAARGLVVTAVEPNASMRGHAAPLPGVNWIDGTFEALPLPAASQRWAIAAQAFHWADPRKALPEIRRVLLPGARFTVFWNDRDMAASAVPRETARIIQDVAPEFDEAYRGEDWSIVLQSTGDFGDPRKFEARHVIAMSRERYLNLWHSHNRLSVAAGDRFPELARRIERVLDDRKITTVDVPYVCRAWSVRRN